MKSFLVVIKLLMVVSKVHEESTNLISSLISVASSHRPMLKECEQEFLC